MKLLVIEDELELSKSICAYLERDNFICEPSYDYQDAVRKISGNDFECILLDLNLPKGNGLDLLKELKSLGKSDGVLIISAKNSLTDKIGGLKLGADDYLTKPFHLPELSARIEAIVRRKYFEGQNKILAGDFTIHLQDKIVYGKTGPIEFTRKEYELLLYFVANKNKVVTKESIVEHLWGDHVGLNDSYDFIYTHIKNLRKKMMNQGCRDFIRVVYGMGYKFLLEEEESKVNKR